MKRKKKQTNIFERRKKNSIKKNLIEFFLLQLMQSANCLYFRQMGMYVPVPSYYDQAQVIKISVNHVLKLLYDQANKRKIIAIYHQVCGVATLYALFDSEVVRLHRNRCVRVFVQCVHAFCFNFSSTHNFIIIQRVEFV